MRCCDVLVSRGQSKQREDILLLAMLIFRSSKVHDHEIGTVTVGHESTNHEQLYMRRQAEYCMTAINQAIHATDPGNTTGLPANDNKKGLTTDSRASGPMVQVHKA